MKRRPLLLGAALASALLAVLRLWPHAPLQSVAPSSRAVFADHGELLRLTLADDGQYRLWVPLERMSPALVQAIRLKEDRYFHWHPGINPLALARAIQSTYSGSMRQGGSTLTMQLARRIYQLNTRRVPGKLQQMALALWLEARYSKHDILEAYLNLAPMGGNIEGAEAASRIYFGIPAEQLPLAQALALAVIPQQPGRRARFGSELETARLRLLASWRENYPGDPRNAGPLELPLQARTRAQLPFLAPHFSELLLQRYPQRELQTTLDLQLQQLLERLIDQYITQQRPQGVENAVALLIDRRDQAVKALVGSADYASKAIHGQVNGVTARRSPGSTLKPFLYGLAIDQGLIHPMSVLKDAPSAYGYFQPENYDGRFVGPISAQDALIRSRNIPAVTLAGQLRAPTLYGLLKRSGVQGLRAESHYGLALTLGAGEVTPEDLGRLYLALGGDGRLRQLRYLRETPQGSGDALLSPQAAFLVRDMLRHNPRPDGLPPDSRGRQWRSAWKTGTSWGFRDAWSSGLVGPYVLVVWVGNFDGRGNPAFVGVKTAAPLFFRIADALPLAQPQERDPKDRPPAGVVRIEVCQASGELPNRWCPQTRKAWYIPGVSPIKVSNLHRPVQVDSRTGRAVCGELDAKYRREEVYEFWPSDLQRLFRAAGLPRRSLPGGARDCLAGSAQPEEGPRIRSPLQQVAYSLRLSHPEDSIPLSATAAADARRLYWFAEQSLVAQNAPQGSGSWRPTRAGDYHLRVTDDLGRSSERLVKVEFLP